MYLILLLLFQFKFNIPDITQIVAVEFNSEEICCKYVRPGKKNDFICCSKADWDKLEQWGSYLPRHPCGFCGYNDRAQ